MQRRVARMWIFLAFTNRITAAHQQMTGAGHDHRAYFGHFLHQCPALALWKEITKRMRAKTPAFINNEEAEKISGFLDKNTPLAEWE